MSKDALTVVTGGAGFIGSHLVERLVAGGRQRVRVVERPGAEASHLPGEGRGRDGPTSATARRSAWRCGGPGTFIIWPRTRTSGCATGRSSTR